MEVISGLMALACMVAPLSLGVLAYAPSIPLYLRGLCGLFVFYFLSRMGWLEEPTARTLLASLSLLGAGLGIWMYRRLPRTTDAFFLGLFALLLSVGPYLEIPADSLSHIESGLRSVPSSKPVYYLFGLAAKPLDPRWRWAILGLWSAFWGTFLLSQFYRIGEALKLPAWARYLAVFATAALFGTNAFSYFRYYVFSAGFYAFLAYLVVVDKTLREQPRVTKACLVSGGIAAVFAALNHLQELLFLLLFFGFALAWQYRAHWLAHPRRTVGAMAVFVAGSIAWIGVFRPAYLHLLLHSPLFETGSVNRTLGLAGFVAIASAIWMLLQKSRLPDPVRFLSFFSVGSIGLLVLPPGYALFCAVFGEQYIVYRVLYGSLYWLALVAALASLRARPWAAYLLVAALSVFPRAPFFGRLYHFGFAAPPLLTPWIYLGAVDYLHRNDPRLTDGTCRVYGDTTAMMAVMALTRWPTNGERNHLPRTSEPLGREGLFLRELQGYNACYVMVRKNRDSVTSKMGGLSGHWPNDFASPTFQVHPSIFSYLAEQTAHFKIVYRDSGVLVYRVL